MFFNEELIRKNVWIIVTLCFFNLRCATIINGSTDTITIQTDQADAKLFINDQFVTTADADKKMYAEVPKRGKINFRIVKPGCQDEEVNVRRELDPTTFLGLLIDAGLFSILIVDYLGTNAIMKASQNYYEFEMECKK